MIRNLKAVWLTREIDRSRRRIVVTDREYTSVALGLRLLDMGYYSVGTISTNRVGLPAFIRFGFKKQAPKNVMRGHYKIAENRNQPNMFVTAWVDSKPCYFLSTGVSAKKAMLKRKLKNGNRVEFQCPQLVKDYNEHMAGVDSHDQLRLQR